MDSDMRRGRAALLRQARRLDAAIDEAKDALAVPRESRRAEERARVSRLHPEEPIAA